MPLFFGITDDAVEQYLYRTLPPRHPVLEVMEAHAEREGVPIIGPLEGQFLYVLARAAGARDLLDVGTATGYSAFWLGLAAQARGGQVVGLERDPQRIALAEQFWRDGGLAATCRVAAGDAFDRLAAMAQEFDFIFLDILTQLTEPDQAVRLAELCLARLRPGGLLVADNAVLAGRVPDPQNHEPKVEVMRRYLAWLQAQAGLATSILPVRDGIAISLRLPGA